MRTIIAMLLSALIGLLSPSAYAIMFQTKSFDDVVAGADEIFVGTVVGVSSRAIFAGGVVTDYTFADVERIKGHVPDDPQVTFLGGTAGSESFLIAGAPRFETGVRYVVFVSGNGSVMFPVVGGPQGIFQVRTDPVTGRAAVYSYGGLPMMAAENGSVRPLESPGFQLLQPRSISLEDFANRVRIRLAR